MHKLFTLLVVLFSFALRCPVLCQATPYALNKGDKLPDLNLTTYTDGTAKKLNTKSLKGKWVLFDFWGMNCVDCIRALPDMLDLQKKFGDQLQIIVVTQDGLEDIQQLWRRFENKPAASKWVKAGKQLPFIVGDKVLSSLFPHRVLPTHSWIDSNGIVQAITYARSTTAENIQRLLQGKKVKFAEQKFVELKVEEPLTWLTDEEIVNNSIPYYSFFTHRIEYGNGGGNPSKIFSEAGDSSISGISCVNHSITDLYKKAYKEKLGIMGDFPDNRMVIETGDSSKFFPDFSAYFSWAENNTYCYAFKTSPSRPEIFYTAMRTDLDRFFGLRSTVEMKKMLSWILKESNSIEKLKNNGKTEKFQRDSQWLIMENKEIHNLFSSLKNIMSLQFPQLLFLNETNYKGKINIKLPWNNDPQNISIPELRRSLQAYGLDLVQEYREVEVLLIREQ